jgi:pSer/pThr/pTyr-binding forkhead associated (FHA) protein
VPSPLDQYKRLAQTGRLLDALQVPVLVWTAPTERAIESTKEFTRPTAEPAPAPVSSKAGIVFELSQSQFVIGRSSACNVQLPDDTISRHHAQLECGRHGWSIVDLGSRNGTWIGQVKLTPRAPMSLTDGARLQMGAVELFFMIPESFEKYLAQL